MAAIRIYNIFPRLLGHIKHWHMHIPRIRAMGFDTIYLNPLSYPGFSGSLYAIKDHYAYNPMFFTSDDRSVAEGELSEFIAACEKQGIAVMMDLVINHTASDSSLAKEHPAWYKKDKDGKFVSPGAWDNGTWISWGDLIEIDNEGSDDKKGLITYWKKLITYNQGLGFSGFRCDAAYKVPAAVWQELITHAKKKKNAVFFAETLGCPMENVIALSDAGFDYIASSARWWDFHADWCLSQYNGSRTHAPSVSFPENHDTLRTIDEYKGNMNRVRLTMLLTALLSAGWMITSGFEWGYRRRCDVVHGMPEDAEPIQYDISDLIRRINAYKNSHDVFRTEGKAAVVLPIAPPEKAGDDMKALASADAKKNRILGMTKESADGKSTVLMLFNTDVEQEQTVDCSPFALKKDISLDGAQNAVPRGDLVIAPGDARVFLL